MIRCLTTFYRGRPVRGAKLQRIGIVLWDSDRERPWLPTGLHFITRKMETPEERAARYKESADRKAAYNLHRERMEKEMERIYGGLTL